MVSNCGYLLSLFLLLSALNACQKTVTTTTTEDYAAIKAQFANKIDPTNLANYANQGKPAYINKDNTGNNVFFHTIIMWGKLMKINHLN